MYLLILLPALAAIWLIATRSIGDALIHVYLPVLLLFPMYYTLDLPHLIKIDACRSALLPIVIAAFVKYGSRWRWQRADAWLLVFAAGFGVSVGRTNFTDGLRSFFDVIFSCFLPYAVGKLLIEEEGLRERVVRRIAWLLAIVALISVVEFRLSVNLFTLVYTKVFSKGSPNIEQIRGGFTRAQGPFGHAIVAGMVFGSVWILALWFSDSEKTKLGANEPRILGFRKSFLLACFSLLGLFLASSRGPWLGGAMAFLISRIGPAKNVARTATMVTLAILILGGAGFAYLNAYTSGTIADAKDQDQENAIYRRLLLTSYGPIADAGGFFGWGNNVPAVPGQVSVDNHYLVLHLSQGLVGLWSFELLGFESILALLLRFRHRQAKADFSFAVALLAVTLGNLLTLTSVYLNFQAIQIFYLCIGWSLANWKAHDRTDSTQPVFDRSLSSPQVFA